MTLIEKVRPLLFGERYEQASICELSDEVRLTVRGRQNDWVTIRLLDSSREPLSFFDEGYVAALEFIIPPDGGSLDVDFAKPSPGEYTFEISTSGGTTHLRYCVA